MAGVKKVLFLTISDRKGASSRYRVYDYLPYLEKAGIDTEVMPPENRAARGITGLFERKRAEDRIINAISGFDAVFVQKRLFPAGFITRLMASGKPLVFDFDDSIFTSPSGGWSYFTKRKVDTRLRSVIRAAGLVITGNVYLKEYAGRIGAKRAEVLPTAIELTKYGVKHHTDRPPVLGWIGSSVNHRYLDMLGDAFNKLSGRVPGLRLMVVSDAAYRAEGVVVENRPWSEKTEAADLAEMDIGLMPLSDDVWTRGKCALKALQYMACGIPAVCSPVGANNEVVEDGVDGFLPSDEGEWVDRIAAPSVSPEMRARMGAAGRRKVEERYSMVKAAGRLVGLLEML